MFTHTHTHTHTAGLCVNVIVTVLLGLIFEHGVKLPSGPLAKFARPLNIHELFGTKLDRLCHPALWLLMCVRERVCVCLYATCAHAQYTHIQACVYKNVQKDSRTHTHTFAVSVVCPVYSVYACICFVCILPCTFVLFVCEGGRVW
jgi:hypothetical protein